MARPKAKVAKAKEMMGPTPERMQHGAFEVEDVTDKRRGGGSITIGKAFRRKRVLDILAEQGLFSEAEAKALRHYRHHADIADQSPLRDSLTRYMPAGGGNGPTIEMLNAVRVVADVERAAGSLCDILRAVIVDDMSLSQWAMARSGAVERCRERKGKRVCQMQPSDKAFAVARLEIKMVAKRVEAELSA